MENNKFFGFKLKLKGLIAEQLIFKVKIAKLNQYILRSLKWRGEKK